MDAINDILVPAFVNELLTKTNCENCEGSLEGAWVRAAGVRLDEENKACFWVSVWCRACEKRRDILFTSYHVMREEWWQDIGCWVGDAARPDRVHLVLSNLKTLPDVALLLRERGKVHRLDLIGAFAGEVGPVVFLYRRTNCHPSKPYGAVRLERHDRLRFLGTGEREALPISRWLWFSGLASDALFSNRGRAWRKLSAGRIREIVQDRVFEPWLGRNGRRGK